MISALLHLLRLHEAPRTEFSARKEEKFADAVSSEMPDPPSSGIPREIKKDDLEAAYLKRPLIPDDTAPPAAGVHLEYRSYLQAVDRLTKAPPDHALDVFE